MSSQLQQRIEFLDRLAQENPIYSEIIENIKVQYRTKLWFQLGLSLLELAKAVYLSPNSSISLTQVYFIAQSNISI